MRSRPGQSSRDAGERRTAAMTVLAVLPFLLLSCALPGQKLTLTAGSDISPEESGLTSLRAVDDVAMDQVLAAVFSRLHSIVLQATAEAQSELSSRLSVMQSSLETLTPLTSRLAAVEQAVADLLAAAAAAPDCRQTVLKTVVSVWKQQESLQTSLSDVIARQDDLQMAMASVSSAQEGVESALKALESRQNNTSDVVSAVSEQLESIAGQQEGVRYVLDLVPTRKEVQERLNGRCSRDEGLSDTLNSLSSTQREMQKVVSNQTSRLTDLAESVAVLSDRQRDTQEALEGLPTRKYIQQSVAVLSSRLDWTQVLEKMTAAQSSALQTLSSHSTRLDGVVDSLAAISDRQLDVQQALSAQSERLDGTSSSLEDLSERQRAAQQTLSVQSDRLAEVTEVVAGTPVPANRPSLVTGRLLGEPCRGDADCSALRADTVCGGDGRCQCAGGLQPVAGETCRSYPRLSEPCRATSDCRGATALAVCADSRCSCPPGLFNYNNTACRSGLGIGEPCHYDSDCSSLVGLTCRAGACAVRTCDAPRSGSYRYRLVGGGSCSDGLIQFTFNSGQLWQYVCDSDWTHADAAVACRYLGFSGGAPLPWNSTAVNEANFFSVKDFVCEGSERSLSACHRVYGRSSCPATELARVKCSEQ